MHTHETRFILTDRINELAIKMHRVFGPGLLEAVIASAGKLQHADTSSRDGEVGRCGWRDWRLAYSSQSPPSSAERAEKV
jgi:hypothetical protein